MRRMFPRRLLLLLLVCALVHPLSAQTDSPAARLHTLLNEEWDYEQRTHPEAATSIGDKRFDDRLTDRSPEARVADRERKQKLLADFEAVP